MFKKIILSYLIPNPYLIYIKLCYDVVKECVQIIEQFHNLMRIIVVILMELDLDFGVGCNDGKGKENFTSSAVLDEERAVKPEF